MTKKKCLECDNIIYRADRKFCSKKCYGKNKSKNSIPITKDLLNKLYIEDKLPLEQISKITNLSIGTICKFVNKYNLKKREVFYHDFHNQKIGSLTVINRFAPNSGGGKHVKWNCICDCGNNHICTSHILRTCLNISCKECQGRKRRKGGIPYLFWHQIESRVLNTCGRIKLEISKDDAYELFKKQNGKCALSGVDIVFAQTNLEHQKGGTTASLDRIDSSKNYTIDNVQWVHKWINLMKLDFSQEEFIEWCNKVSKYNKNS